MKIVTAMKKIRKYRNCVERFISSDDGQRFFNFAYSIGAAIVIWGALFKILHLPGGEVLLAIGMGTEVLMFILTAFDRPGKEYRWEEVFPELEGGDKKEAGCHNSVASSRNVSSIQRAGDGCNYSPTIIGSVAEGDVAGVTNHYIDQMQSINQQLEKLRATTESLNNVSETLLGSYKAITENKDIISASANGYAEQMQALSRNISGLNTIYEIQLKSVSGQLEAIDRVNQGIRDIRDMYERSASQSSRYAEETEKMARHMEQLNHVYEKMLHAMTVNMYRPGTPVDAVSSSQSMEN